MHLCDSKSNRMFDKIDFLLFSTFPIYPLIDYMIAHDFMLYNAIVEKIPPYATVIAYSFFILVSLNNLKFYPFQISFASCFLFSIAVNTYQNGWIWEYGPAIMIIIICTFLVSIFLNKNQLQTYLYFKYFGYCYTFLVFFIFLYRFIFLDMSVARLRAGGMYAAHAPAIWFLIMIFLAMENGKKKDALMYFFLLVLDGIIFASRGVVIVSLMIFIYFCFKYKIRYIIPVTTVLLIILGNIYFFGMSDLIQTRMSFRHSNSFRSENFFLGSRYPIVIEGIALLTENNYIELFGYGIGKYKYLTERSVGSSKISSPHNMLLDAWGTGGFLGLFFLVYLLVMTTRLVNNKMLYIIITVYAIFEGVSLFYSGTIMWGYNYLAFLYIYYDSKRRNMMKMLQ